MNITQKCQYALRAILELSKKRGRGPLSVREIAEAQAIPSRFLELILRELRQGGYVESRRGVEGGYLLEADPEGLTVGEIIRLIDGSFDPVKCLGSRGAEDCPLQGRCAFLNLWERARQALEDVYDTTTFAQLIREEEERNKTRAVDFCI